MKIVIVGGGTAGWLTALKLMNASKLDRIGGDKNKTLLTDLDITLIESSKIGIIGAGEGSTGIMTDMINTSFKDIGITEVDFLNNTESILKMGIRFKDWNGVNTEYLSPIANTQTSQNNFDVDFLSFLYKGYCHDASFGGYLMDREYSPYYTTKNKKTNGQHSYHFDATKVGAYFKKFALKLGVKCIDTEINSLNRNSISGELQSVETTIGKIDADFWIDCSGFSRVLIEPMGSAWKSYQEYLPTNNALPYIHQYETNEVPKMETLAWAQPNGWMWQIPNQQRYGCGYVYSDYFTTQDKALDELKKNTGRDINPIRNIKFTPGRTEKFWVSNVVAIGLSSCFLEPLQATSIHSTIVQIDLLINWTSCLFGDKKSFMYKSIMDKYNNFFIKLCDDFRDLIQMQYITDREDSEFWKYCKYALPKTDKVKEILEISKHRCPSSLDFDKYFGSAGWPVWSWTLAGLGHINKDTAKFTLDGYRDFKYAMDRHDSVIKSYKTNSMVLLKNKDFIKALKDKKLI
jgi:tryptophan halogenase